MQPTPPLPIGIFAASSIVPPIEFQAGIEFLSKSGFDPRTAEQVLKHDFIFAGSDEERAEAIYRLAIDPSIPILWAARGGYGAGRLLPILQQLTKAHGMPKQKKLLVGYSDVTVLHEFVRARWGWCTLHAPMPAASNFSTLDAREWESIVDFVKQKPTAPPWERAPLRWMTDAPTSTLRAELIGGNLSLWAALAGTPYARPGKGKIIFLEDIDEAFYRIDRMMIQLEQSGAFDGAAAIVLGDFTNCKDENNTCRASAAGGERMPLRKIFEQPEAFQQIFTPIGQRLGVPIAQGLPVGHGPHFSPLPLGATYELSPQGMLRLVEWDWLKSAIA
ncbi:MAG: LD-carboxypeptidase [Tepidisphaeraceae bacterium]